MLTPEELEVMDLTCLIFNKLQHIILDGPSREADVAEMVHHVHAIQRAVLAQSAARVYPNQFRLLGSTVGNGCPIGLRHHECDCEPLETS